MSEYMLEVENLKKHFGPVKAVDGVSFKIKKGESFGLVGESGCGKTTLGRTILQLMEPTSGKVYFNTSLEEGEPPRKFDISAKEQLFELRKKMQIVYQDPGSSLNPRKLIRDLVGEPLVVHNILRGNELQERVTDLLIRVGLQEEHLWRYPFELSGGQRQRVAIARSIALQPEFLVLDEPTSALDLSVQAKILNLLKDLQRDYHITYLCITHDMSVIDYMCDRVGVMYLGKLLEVSPKDQLFKEQLFPYSKALLSAIPSMNPRSKKMANVLVLPGEVGSPANPPLGCRFHPRCKEVFGECGWSAGDLITYLQDNGIAKGGLSFKKEAFHLEIRPSGLIEVSKQLENVSDIIEKGKQQKLPIFDAMEHYEIVDKDTPNWWIHVHFKEKREPELVDVGKDRHVACLLYYADPKV